jgi:hypothetical protein
MTALKDLKYSTITLYGETVKFYISNVSRPNNYYDSYISISYVMVYADKPMTRNVSFNINPLSRNSKTKKAFDNSDTEVVRFKNSIIKDIKNFLKEKQIEKNKYRVVDMFIDKIKNIEITDADIVASEI